MKLACIAASPPTLAADRPQGFGHEEAGGGGQGRGESPASRLPIGTAAFGREFQVAAAIADVWAASTPQPPGARANVGITSETGYRSRGVAGV